MLRGIILILTLLGADTPEEAILDTWDAIQDGSPRTFLSTLSPTCSANILQICSEYLETMKTLTPPELGELFASFRLEAAPNEIEFWDSTAVLEMLISSPGHHQTINRSTITIDSIQSAESTARAFVTINMPDDERTTLVLPVTASTLGWHTAELESIAGTILDSTISN
ncbi:MAG: hypothetical protein GQ565_07565 [Candidatus Aegiribacteria sp.]|nr:hypothetical protein [Candidatus Aegiribacteria sp.]